MALNDTKTSAATELADGNSSAATERTEEPQLAEIVNHEHTAIAILPAAHTADTVNLSVHVRVASPFTGEEIFPPIPTKSSILREAVAAPRLQGTSESDSHPT